MQRKSKYQMRYSLGGGAIVGSCRYGSGLSLISVCLSVLVPHALFYIHLGDDLATWKLAQILGMNDFRASVTPMRRFSKAELLV